jgi:hypothetical protein
MVAAWLEPRSGAPLNLFNARFWGRAVSLQAVSGWLCGQAIQQRQRRWGQGGVG